MNVLTAISPVLPFLILFAPVPFFVVYAILQQRRRNAKAAATEITEPKPFEPTPEPAPNAFLRRFNSPERTFLRAQGRTALIGFCVVVWVFTVLLASNLLPQSLNYFGVEAPTPTLVWYSFIHGGALTSTIAWFCGIIAALTANAGILGSMKLNRTRPVPHAVLFWGRTVPALLTLLAGYATSLALAFLLMLATYGPVWNRLDDAPTRPGSSTAGASAGGIAESPDATPDDPDTETQQHRETRHRRWLTHASPARLFLSTATNMTLIFATFIALFAQPWQSGRKLNPGVALVLGAFGFVVFFPLFLQLFGVTGNGAHLQALFVYSPDGAAPPWHSALVPIALSAALLSLARTLFPRAEV